MDDHELAADLGAMIALEVAPWRFAGTLLLTAVVVTLLARRARSGPRAGVVAVVVLGVALTAAATAAWVHTRRVGDAATAEVTAWLQNDQGLTVTGAGRGCGNDIPGHENTCLRLPARDTSGTERGVTLRWFELPDDVVDLQVEVDLPVFRGR